jgi:hypothetical protein
MTSLKKKKFDKPDNLGSLGSLDSLGSQENPKSSDNPLKSTTLLP